MKASVKQRINCFQNNLGSFLTEHQNYLQSRKEGKRKSKNK